MVSFHLDEREKAVAKAYFYFVSFACGIFVATFFVLFLILKIITVVIPFLIDIFTTYVGLRPRDAEFCALLFVISYGVTLLAFMMDKHGDIRKWCNSNKDAKDNTPDVSADNKIEQD
jgi:hypothetical protein